MPDLSEFEKYDRKRTRNRPPCGVKQAMEEIAKDELGALKAALDTERTLISNKAIELWLEARDVRCSLQVISAHRRRVCSCHE